MNLTVKILKKPITSTLIAILCGFIVASIILAFAGYNPFEIIGVMFKGIFARPKSVANVIIKATPIILTGVSVAFAFKTGLFNIGSEGQFIIGSVTAVIFGITFNFHPIIQIPMLMLVGILAGGVYGSIVGFLKARFGIHEVITSIMLNWIALYFLNYISNSKTFHKPNTTGTYDINNSGLITLFRNMKESKEGIATLKKNPYVADVVLKTDINIGILIAILVAIVAWFLLYKTTKGYELRAVGFNPNSSRCAGIDVDKNILQSMLISGAISGLAGAITVMGITPHNVSVLSVFENNGFNGLSVALIANSSPIGCIFAGLLFSGLIYGGRSVQFETGAPSEIINIMIGTIVFFVALTRIVPVLADRLERKRVKKDAD